MGGARLNRRANVAKPAMADFLTDPETDDELRARFEIQLLGGRGD